MSISIEALKTKFDSLLQTISNHINGKLGREEAAVSAAKLTTPFTLSLTNDASATANVDGSQAIALSVILKTVMASPGTYTKVTVDAKGRVVAAEALIASDIPNLDASKVTTGVFAVARIPTLNQNTTGNAATATKLATPRQIAVSGDATGTVAFDGSGDVSIPLTLKSSGVAAGAYGDSVTIPTFSVDGKGIVTLAQNVAIRTASLTQTGLVRLNSATNSTLENQAATPLAVKTAYDLAAAAIPVSQKGAAGGVCELDGESFIPTIRLSNSGVVAGTYGGATQIPQVTVDNKGRVTGVTLIDIKAQTAMAVNEYITVAAGGVKSYDLQTLLGANHASFDKKTAEICVRVKDINGSSPLYNAYANAEALVSYGIKDERTVIIANQHTAPVDLYVKVLVHPL